MDTISVLIGFLIGVVATMIAVEFGLKKIFRPPALNKVTGSWRLDDHKAPLVVTQDAGHVALPRNARVVTAGSVDPNGFTDRDHRRNPNARSNFVVDPELDRALIFMGPIREGTLALASLDPAVAARLRAEHRRLWETGEAYVVDVGLADVAKKPGLLVRVRGRVQECIAYRENHLLRITDGKNVVGAIVEKQLELDNQGVVVTGRVVRGTSGYPLLEAEEVRLDQEGAKRVPTSRPARRRQSAASLSPGDAQPQPEAPRVAQASAEPAPPSAAPQRRILRVPRSKRDAQPEEPEAAPEEHQEQLEFEEAEPVMTQAEASRRRARVTLHR